MSIKCSFGQCNLNRAINASTPTFLKEALSNSIKNQACLNSFMFFFLHFKTLLLSVVTHSVPLLCLTFPLMQPTGKGPRLPEVYCVISRLGCFDLFSKVSSCLRLLNTFPSIFSNLELLLCPYEKRLYGNLC